MNLLQKILEIQKELDPLFKDSKLDTESYNTWVSDAQVRRALRPLLIKHGILSRLVSAEVIPIGEGKRVVRGVFEFIDTENPEDSLKASVDYEIGAADLTGTGITLAGKYAHMNTFFMETSFADEGGGKPLGSIASPSSPADKAMALVETSSSRPQALTQGNFDYTQLHPDWDKTFETVRKMGINVSDFGGFKFLNFDYRDMLKSFGMKASMKEKQLLCTAIKLGVVDDYMAMRFGSYAYEKRVPAGPLFSGLSYSVSWSDEAITGYIPTVQERGSSAVLEHFVNFLSGVLGIDELKLEAFVTKLVNSGEAPDIAFNPERGCQNIQEWLMLASPSDIDGVVAKYVASVVS